MHKKHAVKALLRVHEYTWSRKPVLLLASAPDHS